METALSYIYQIYSKFMNFVFNDFVIYEPYGVTFGWLIVVLIVFSILFSNLLMLGKRGESYSFSRNGGNSNERC